MAWPGQDATHMPQATQAASPTTTGSDVMLSPMEMQPFLQASWQGLQGMF